jgi:TetR/AcrR family tetracycline transcriptional repressor
MRLSGEAIAGAALGLLAEVGLNGLTMRLVARELNVGASAIYGHFKDKQELLDAMATLLFVEAAEGLEAPRQGIPWDVWLADWMRCLRSVLLRYRDGALVLAGTYVNHPAMLRSSELTLRTMEDAGFGPSEAARSVSVLVHYVLSFCIEEQARAGHDYSDGSPYHAGQIAETIDAKRYPLTAQLMKETVTDTPEADFEYGMQVILNGIHATRTT